MADQLTLLQDWNPIHTYLGNPEPEHNTQDMQAHITEEEINGRQLSQKDKIMQLLMDMDRVPSDLFPKIGLSQYNARINELNRELAG